MLKKIIQVTSLISAFFILALSHTAARLLEISYPLQSNVSFVLNTQNSKLTKPEIIETLESLALEHQLSIAKPIADAENPKTGRNVLVFGSARSGNVFWLNSQYKGRYLSSKEITTEPLNGKYYLHEPSDAFQMALRNWAAAANIDLLWGKRQSISRVVLGMLIQTSSGLALLSAFILMFAVCLSWFLSSERSRAIRLMAGLAKWRISLEDLARLSYLLFLPALLVFILALLGFSLFYQSLRVIPMMLPFLIFATLFVFLLTAFCLLIFAYLFQASIKSLADRESSYKYAKFLGIALRASAIILLIVGLPLALRNVTLLKSNAQNLDQWSKITDAYSLSLGQSLLSQYEDSEDRLNDFLNSIDEDKILISASFDSFLQVPPGIKLGYDHLVLTNQPFLDALNEEALEELSPSKIPENTLSFITDNLKLWSRDWRSDHPKIAEFKLYRRASSDAQGSLPVLTKGIRIGVSERAENPLLIVLSDPIADLDPQGLLLPMLVNGNFLYRDYDQLSSLLEKSQLQEHVMAIDNATSLFLENAQNLRAESYLGGVGVILSFLALLTSLFQSAMSWSYRRRVEIFLAITNGHQPWRIGMSTAMADSLFALLIAVSSYIVFVQTAGIQDFPQVLSALVLLISFYTIASFVLYSLQARSAFKATIQRNY